MLEQHRLTLAAVLQSATNRRLISVLNGGHPSMPPNQQQTFSIDASRAGMFIEGEAFSCDSSHPLSEKKRFKRFLSERLGTADAARVITYYYQNLCGGLVLLAWIFEKAADGAFTQFQHYSHLYTRDSDIYLRTHLYQGKLSIFCGASYKLALPGSVTLEYQLTADGFQLSYIECSNRTLLKLLLDDPTTQTEKTLTACAQQAATEEAARFKAAKGQLAQRALALLKLPAECQQRVSTIVKQITREQQAAKKANTDFSHFSDLLLMTRECLDNWHDRVIRQHYAVAVQSLLPTIEDSELSEQSLLQQAMMSLLSEEQSPPAVLNDPLISLVPSLRAPAEQQKIFLAEQKNFQDCLVDNALPEPVRIAAEALFAATQYEASRHSAETKILGDDDLAMRSAALRFARQLMEFFPTFDDAQLINVERVLSSHVVLLCEAVRAAFSPEAITKTAWESLDHVLSLLQQLVDRFPAVESKISELIKRLDAAEHLLGPRLFLAVLQALELLLVDEVDALFFHRYGVLVMRVTVSFPDAGSELLGNALLELAFIVAKGALEEELLFADKERVEARSALQIAASAAVDVAPSLAAMVGPDENHVCQELAQYLRMAYWLLLIKQQFVAPVNRDSVEQYQVVADALGECYQQRWLRMEAKVMALINERSKEDWVSKQDIQEYVELTVLMRNAMMLPEVLAQLSAALSPKVELEEENIASVCVVLETQADTPTAAPSKRIDHWRYRLFKASPASTAQTSSGEGEANTPTKKGFSRWWRPIRSSAELEELKETRRIPFSWGRKSASLP